jgi:Ser/Thr protein kinase RdoA (MazF antagonist)
VATEELGRLETMREAADRLFPSGYRLDWLGGSTGYSGSAFARVEAAGDAWCLRRWPRRVSGRRLAFVHRALATSRAAGFAGAPALARTAAGETVVRAGGALHDAQGWTPGTPLAAATRAGLRWPNRVEPASAAHLAGLGAALAAFHASTAGLAPDAGATTAPLAQSLRETRRAVEAVLARRPPRSDAGPDAAEFAAAWRDALPVAVAAAAGALERHPAVATDAGTLCHGDLWPAHVFVVGATVSGLVDFEGLAFSSPATDLAQLVLHFGGWAARDVALAAYQAVRPLDGATVACLPAAAVLDAAAEGAWALAALGAPRERARRAAHLANLRDLIGPLDGATRSLLAGSAV